MKGIKIKFNKLSFFNQKQRFSLSKKSIGLVTDLLDTSFFLINNQVVKADSTSVDKAKTTITNTNDGQTKSNTDN